MNEVMEFLQCVNEKDLSGEGKEILVEDEFLSGIQYELLLGSDLESFVSKESYEKIKNLVSDEVDIELRALWHITYPSMIDNIVRTLPLKNELSSLGVTGWFALYSDLLLLKRDVLLEFLANDWAGLASDIRLECLFFQSYLGKWVDAIECAIEEKSDLFIYVA